MNTLLFRIKTANNPHLEDEDLVANCMEQLMAKWPQVTGYQYERVEDAILILMWGDLTAVQEEE